MCAVVRVFVAVCAFSPSSDPHQGSARTDETGKRKEVEPYRMKRWRALLGAGTKKEREILAAKPPSDKKGFPFRVFSFSLFCVPFAFSFTSWVSPQKGELTVFGQQKVSEVGSRVGEGIRRRELLIKGWKKMCVDTHTHTHSHAKKEGVFTPVIAFVAHLLAVSRGN